jgi:D-alanyl-D-alanine carboxypeptidase (penicillin-binding protein 5/6)
MYRKSPKHISKRFISILFLTIITFEIIVIQYFPKQANATQNQQVLPNLNSATSNLLESKNVGTTSESSSYLMINARTGEKLLAQNEEERRQPASTLKLLTGIVTIDKLHEDDLIRVGDEVRNVEGSQLGLKPGDQILVKDLLTALYVESANDAAVVLAVSAYGTMNDFLTAMNQYAIKIGCTNSQFKTPNGLPQPDQYTTAHDLTQIASEFIKREELMKYVKMKEATVQWTSPNGYKQKRVIKNTNQLLGVYPGDIGLKTGTTTEAGQCLVTYITRPDGDILLVLLRSKQRYSETIELLDQGISSIRTRSALKNITSQPDTVLRSPGFFAP